uniref:DUF350 domain-containing protein n=1 Tax=Escherichia coli TaxID=562 RepID=UPI00330683E8
KSVSWQHHPFVLTLHDGSKIQLLVFAGVRLYMPALSEKIINHNTAAGMFMGTAALAGGIFNAACMTW